MAFPFDHDVGRLQIAMDDAGLVRGNESGSHLLGNREDAIDREFSFALDDRRQIRSLHVRHRDIRDAVELTKVVDSYHVPVSHLTREEQLAFEALLHGPRVVGIHRLGRPNHLNGDGHFEHAVPGLIDRAHPAGAEQPDDVIPRAEILTHRERAGGRAHMTDARFSHSLTVGGRLRNARDGFTGRDSRVCGIGGSRRGREVSIWTYGWGRSGNAGDDRQRVAVIMTANLAAFVDRRSRATAARAGHTMQIIT